MIKNYLLIERTCLSIYICISFMTCSITLTSQYANIQHDFKAALHQCAQMHSVSACAFHDILSDDERFDCILLLELHIYGCNIFFLINMICASNLRNFYMLSLPRPLHASKLQVRGTTTLIIVVVVITVVLFFLLLTVQV